MEVSNEREILLGVDWPEHTNDFQVDQCIINYVKILAQISWKDSAYQQVKQSPRVYYGWAGAKPIITSLKEEKQK